MVRLYSIALLGFTLLPTVLSDTNFPDLSFSIKDKIRGVNLGGWLVLEPWITPSLFDNTGNDKIIDEYTFGQYQDKATARAALKKHWDTFITEDDFRQIAAAKLNLVRIPVGYWAYDITAGEPYIQGQDDYLRKAVGWADKHGVKVLIDLHGAPGSQNGFDNSGQKIDPPMWHTKKSYLQRTRDVIQHLTESYKSSPAVISIAPLNEPASFKAPEILNVTKQYWRDSYKIVRKQSGLGVVIHDAFRPVSEWQGFMPAPQYQGVLLDTHVYQIFSPEENARSDEEHIQVACDKASDIKDSDIAVVVGEWTPAFTDCAKYLNGRGVGSRYDGTFDDNNAKIGDCEGKTGLGSSFDDAFKESLRQSWEAQTLAYEKGAGWIQWSWKTEVAHEWSYKAGLDFKWISYNPEERKYPNICGKDF